MSRLCRFLLILIAACTVVGCEPEDTGIWWVKQKSLEYKKGFSFVPNSELEVWSSYQGEAPREISLRLVKISISEPPYLPDEQQEVQYDTAYTLKNEGDILIIVEYDGKSNICTIKVSPAGMEIITEWEK
jgi:hypothetical protein